MAIFSDLPASGKPDKWFGYLSDYSIVVINMPWLMLQPHVTKSRFTRTHYINLESNTYFSPIGDESNLYIDLSDDDQDSQLSSDRLETTYGLSPQSTPLHLALLSVNHQIRDITVPIFYKAHRIKLDLEEGVIPFLGDRGTIGRQSIRDLYLSCVQIDGDAADNCTRKLWAANVDYIREHLSGLRTLRVYMQDDSLICELENDMKAHRALDDKELGDPHMSVVLALSKLRGLSTFQITLCSAVWTTDDDVCGYSVASGFLQEFLQRKVCQPLPVGGSSIN